jgi:hypothetical protein
LFRGQDIFAYFSDPSLVSEALGIGKIGEDVERPASPYGFNKWSFFLLKSKQKISMVLFEVFF